LVRVELGHVHHDNGSLGGTWRSDKKSVLVTWLFSNGGSHQWKVGDLVNNELSSGRITSWDQKL
jgi:hypothetical protein